MLFRGTRRSAEREPLIGGKARGSMPLGGDVHAGTPSGTVSPDLATGRNYSSTAPMMPNLGTSFRQLVQTWKAGKR